MKNTSLILSRTQIETPLGGMTAIASEYGLFILTFQEETAWINTKISKYYPAASFGSKYENVLDYTRKWIKGYFEPLNERLPLSFPPFDLQGSSFSKNVWKILLDIPFGSTATYGEIARHVGSPKAARAVGKAVGNNPLALIVPCHRILGRNNTLTGFRSGIERKAWLLQHERGGSLIKT